METVKIRFECSKKELEQLIIYILEDRIKKAGLIPDIEIIK